MLDDLVLAVFAGAWQDSQGVYWLGAEDLAELFALDAATAEAAVERLIAAGLVSDPVRSEGLSITEAGLARLRELQGGWL